MISEERLQKTKDILDDASQVMDKLNMIAADDGMIDNDEVDLINVIDTHLRRYRKLLREVLKDDYIDDNELNRMKTLEREITNAIQTQATKDGKITSSESQLINSLLDCLKSFKSLESF